MPELSALLKQVRLSHALEYLAQRNKEAIEKKLSHPEFLSLLIQDELLGRQNKKFQERIKRAHIRMDKTLENFDFSINPKINSGLIKELMSCDFIAEKVPVLIVGPCGTGKSHLSQAIAHCAIRRNIDVLWMSQNALLSSLQAAKAVNSYEKKLAQLSKIPLLIIDDFGLKPMRTPQDEDFHDVIDKRYEQAATIVTSNLDFNE